MRLLTLLGAIAAALSTLILLGLAIAYLLQLHRERAIDPCCESHVEAQHDPRMQPRYCAITADSHIVDQHDRGVANAEISLLVEYQDHQGSAELIRASSDEYGHWQVEQRSDCNKRATITLKIQKPGYISHIATASDLHAPVTLYLKHDGDQGGIDRQPAMPRP